MKKLTSLWHKYKQNENKVRRNISIALTALLMIAIGYLAVSMYLSDKALAASQEVTAQDKSPIAQDKNRNYGEAGFRVIAENDSLILYADTTNGELAVEEKTKHVIWYSNPQDKEEDTVAPQKSRLKAQINITTLSVPVVGRNLYSTTGSTAYAKSTIDSSNDCVELGGLDYELIENGIRFVYSFPKVGIRIPVEYTIEESVFAAEVVTEEIEELWAERYLLLSVDVLPFFGAGGQEDEGYLLIPDGSGALIYYNNGKNRFAQYSKPVYGTDPVAPGEVVVTQSEQIHMPVFGLKTNENALFAIITSGDALGQITALPSGKLSTYNQAYSSLLYRTYQTNGSGRSMVGVYSEPLLEEPYRVEYIMLEGEEADYAGMANAYREWLLEQGEIKTSELAKDSYMVLNLYGAVSIEKYVMGIMQNVVTPLTTYQNVIDIVKQLKADGVENIIINYIGALDGGLNAEPMNNFKPESALGGKKDFEKMTEYLEQEGVILFLESDPINLYEDGNGYEMNGDAVLSFYEKYAYQYLYSLNLGEAREQTRWNLIKPLRIRDITEEYFASALKNGITNYSAASIGSLLYSDYDEDTLCYRQESLSLWQSALASAADKFDYVMVEGGNAYTLAYTDIIREVSFEYSNYDITDESVPFYQMVLSGSVAMGAPSFNMGSDYHYRFLKSLETGCNISYTWMAEEARELVGTEYNTLTASGYDYWIETAIAQYQESEEIREKTAGQRIIDHEKLAEDVYETVYESGIRIYVNYSKTDYCDGELLIPAKGYTAVE
ncbi:MAG: hypothetical protein J6B85_01885 [Lachnospiraceae bacterium]|nr:hypothetical protein [Lachnospiraceae bacterium]